MRNSLFKILYLGVIFFGISPSLSAKVYVYQYDTRASQSAGEPIFSKLRIDLLRGVVVHETLVDYDSLHVRFSDLVTKMAPLFSHYHEKRDGVAEHSFTSETSKEMEQLERSLSPEGDLFVECVGNDGTTNGFFRAFDNRESPFTLGLPLEKDRPQLSAYLNGKYLYRIELGRLFANRSYNTFRRLSLMIELYETFFYFAGRHPKTPETSVFAESLVDTLVTYQLGNLEEEAFPTNVVLPPGRHLLRVSLSEAYRNWVGNFDQSLHLSPEQFRTFHSLLVSSLQKLRDARGRLPGPVQRFHFSSWYHEARILVLLRRYEEALPLLRRLSNWYPDSAGVELLLIESEGGLRFVSGIKKGNLSEALAYMNNVTLREPFDIRTRLTLMARLLVGSGQTSEALLLASRWPQGGAGVPEIYGRELIRSLDRDFNASFDNSVPRALSLENELRTDCHRGLCLSGTIREYARDLLAFLGSEGLIDCGLVLTLGSFVQQH
jgi:hypothetical protein